MFLKLECPEALIVCTIVLFFHRPVKERLMVITAVTYVTVGILAIVIIILTYFGRKKGKIFCNKHVQKGNIF